MTDNHILNKMVRIAGELVRPQAPVAFLRVWAYSYAAGCTAVSSHLGGCVGVCRKKGEEENGDATEVSSLAGPIGLQWQLLIVTVHIRASKREGCIMPRGCRRASFGLLVSGDDYKFDYLWQV